MSIVLLYRKFSIQQRFASAQKNAVSCVSVIAVKKISADYLSLSWLINISYNTVVCTSVIIYEIQDHWQLEANMTNSEMMFSFSKILVCAGPFSRYPTQIIVL